MRFESIFVFLPITTNINLQRREALLPVVSSPRPHHVITNARLSATIPRASQNFSAASGWLVNNVTQIGVSL